MLDLSRIGMTSQGPFNYTGNSTSKDRTWNLGNLAIGEVMKLYPKRYTADVRIGQTSDMLRGSAETEGRFACRIGVSSAGFSSEYQMPYGEIRPLHVGDLVLVGFLKNNEGTPVILKVLHDISESEEMANYRNILPNTYDPERDTEDITDYLNITPIQDYRKVDKFGNFEISSHTKSFIVSNETDFDEELFDYEDLTVKFPVDKSVVSTQAHVDTQYELPAIAAIESGREDKLATVHVNELNSKPKKYLAVFRDNFFDTVTNWLRFVINAGKTSFKMLQAKRIAASTSVDTDTSVASSSSDTGVTSSIQGDGAMTVLDLEETGTLRIRRHLDTYKYKDADSKHFTDIQLNKDGSIIVEVNNQYESSGGDYGTDTSIIGNFPNHPQTVVSIDGTTGEVKLTTTSKLTVTTQQGIEMNSKDDITMTSEKQISIMSKNGVIIGSEEQIGILSKKPITMQSDEIVGIDGAKGASFTSSQAAIQISGVDDVAVTSAKGTLGLASTQAVKTMSANIEMTGAIKQTGSVKTTGAQTNYGSVRSYGALTHNGRAPAVDGDHDDDGDRNWAIFCNVLISMVETFVVEQAVSMVLKQLPSVSSLVATVAKEFRYYQAATLGIKSLENMYAGLRTGKFDTMATGMSQLATGIIISGASPFNAQLKQFVRVSNKIAKSENTLGMFSKKTGLTNLSNSLVSAGDGLNVLTDSMNDSINLADKHSFVNVSTPFVDLEELGLMSGSLESEESITSQMKFITSKVNDVDENGDEILDENGNPVSYGLGIDLQQVYQDAYTNHLFDGLSDVEIELRKVLLGITEYWNKFSQPNDVSSIIDFVCREDYAKTGRKFGQSGQVIGTEKYSPYNLNPNKYTPVTYDLSEAEKAAIKDAVSTLHTDYNLSVFQGETLGKLSRGHRFADGTYKRLYGTDIGEGYMNELADLIDMSSWKQEGDSLRTVKEFNGTATTAYDVNTETTKTYSIMDSLKQLGNLVYPDGWRKKATAIDKLIDQRLGTNCAKYAGVNWDLYFLSQLILNTSIPNKAIMEQYKTPKVINTKDQFIDMVVKRYLWENAQQFLAQLNYAWKTHQCRKEAWKITDDSDPKNPNVTYDTSVYSFNDVVERVNYANSSGVDESLQNFPDDTNSYQEAYYTDTTVIAPSSDTFIIDTSSDTVVTDTYVTDPTNG